MSSGHALQRPKPEDLQKVATSASGDNKIASSKQRKLTKDNERLEDWGELNTGKQAPIVCVLDIPTRQVVALGGQRDDTSYGQPHWSPTGHLLLVRSLLLLFASCRHRHH